MESLVLIGNLGADAKLVSNNGRPFVSFSVANTERWKDEQGVDHEQTDWVSCALNGENQKLLPYLKAGQKVCCIGKIRTRVYSSAKERRLVAGLNMSVNQLELIAAAPDDVPSRLYSSDGEEVRVYKAFYVATQDAQRLGAATLFSRSGSPYALADGGWVSPVVQEQGEEQGSGQSQQSSAAAEDAANVGQNEPY